MRALADDEEKVGFWRRHTVVGVVLCLVLPAVAALDTWLSPGAPSATARYAVCAVTALLSPLLLLVPVDRVVRHPYGRLFFDGWEAAGLALVLTMVALDGGDGSPYLQFLFVLLAHAALAYPPVGMVVAGLVAVAGYLGVLLLTGGAPGHTIVTGTFSLLVTTATCALASHNHVLAYRRTARRARRVQALAELDGLTGCLNNRAFHDRLGAAGSAVADDRPVSVVVLDIDHFKDVNDQHGHPAGDAVLQGVGGVLRAESRAGDVAGRLGGDEFALLLPGTGADEAVRVAERLRTGVGRLAAQHAVTVSVGVATAGPGTDGAALLAAADRAVYVAKRGGRDRVAAPEPEAG